MPYRVNTYIYQGRWNYDVFLSGLIWLGSCTAFAQALLTLLAHPNAQLAQVLITLAHSLLSLLRR